MRHRQAIALLSLVGFFVALYLWLYKIGVIGTLQCGTGGCEVVQTSRWAMLFGIPVAFYGVVGYGVMFGLSFAGTLPALAGRRWPTLALAALAGGAFLFALYLTYLELFVIHAICRWCVVSAVIAVVLFALVLWDWRTSRTVEA